MSIRIRSFVPTLLLAAVSFSRYHVTCSLTSSTTHRIIVVGKIIIDEYGGPEVEHRRVSIGGGGPQAAFGAAAALAFLAGDEESFLVEETPAPQPVAFFGPVGEVDWSTREEEVLMETLQGAVQSIHLIRGGSLRTPRIQLWHDELQNVLWKPIDDSFGSHGADQLWRNRPSADDLLRHLRPDEMVAMHVVLEGGRDSPTRGEDSTFLLDPRLRKHVEFLGVEPVVFQDETTSRVNTEDVVSCCERLSRLSNLDCVSPDMALYREASADDGCLEGLTVAVRNGPAGSVLLGRYGSSQMNIPAASLVTNDVNPTGAGNAYAAAFTTCLSMGASDVKSACIASAIGAVFCEYEHIPQWDRTMFVRLRQAVADVEREMTAAASWRERTDWM